MNVSLHSGAVIGADGFGFAPTPNGYDKIPQIGIVILEDKVDIGANTCRPCYNGSYGSTQRCQVRQSDTNSTQ